MMLRTQIFDDLAQMAGGTIGIASSLRRQIREEIKTRVDEMAYRLDLVPRQEVENLEALVQELRLQQEDILKRLAACEAKKSKSTQSGKQKTTIKERKS